MSTSGTDGPTNSQIEKRLQWEFLLGPQWKRLRLESIRMRFDPWPHSVGGGSDVAVSCGVGHRQGSDPAWLWCRPAAIALIGPLAWEPPYATGAALNKAKKKKCLTDYKFGKDVYLEY